MAMKNAVEVVIGGKVYKISGYESSEYLHQIAVYINDKMTEFQNMDSYRKQTMDQKQLMLNMNLADEFFKAKRQGGQAFRGVGEEGAGALQCASRSHRGPSGSGESAKGAEGEGAGPQAGASAPAEAGPSESERRPEYKSERKRRQWGCGKYKCRKRKYKRCQSGTEIDKRRQTDYGTASLVFRKAETYET